MKNVNATDEIAPIGPGCENNTSQECGGICIDDITIKLPKIEIPKIKLPW